MSDQGASPTEDHETGTDESRLLTRRRFLGGLGAAGVLATGYGLSVWARGRSGSSPPLSSAAGTTTTRATREPDAGLGVGGRTLVVVEMAGGNDSLNTVVPHADSRYFDLRPTLAVTDSIDLDGEIGLHPELTRLAEAYEAGDLAVVEGVGTPEPDLSHFASLRTWWTAELESSGGSGWLGRYLDATVGYDDPIAGITIGPGPSPALTGDASFASSIAGADGLSPGLPIGRPEIAALYAQWESMAPAGADPGTLAGRVGETIRSTVEASERLDAALGDEPSGGDGGLRADLAAALGLAARLVASDDSPRVVWVRFDGDFDTHQGQAGRHPALMAELNAGISAYLDTLDTMDTTDAAVLMTVSEFGRRAEENGTGTDHGTAAAHLVLGGAVRGGRYGEAPSLQRLDDNGNLVATVDIVDYYASVLEGWLHTDAERIVGPAEALPLFA